MGPKSEGIYGADSPYGSTTYTRPDCSYDYTFHAEYSTLDEGWNAPGVHPKRDVLATTDVFPFVTHRWCLSIGPLLAISPVEMVFLSTIKGDGGCGIPTRVGLIRVSRLSTVMQYEGQRLNDPLLGEIQCGDLSLWRRYHRPPVEEYVRLLPPAGHDSPPAILWDFKVNRPIACIPSLISQRIIHLDPPTFAFFDRPTDCPRVDQASASPSFPTGTPIAHAGTAATLFSPIPAIPSTSPPSVYEPNTPMSSDSSEYLADGRRTPTLAAPNGIDNSHMRSFAAAYAESLRTPNTVSYPSSGHDSSSVAEQRVTHTPTSTTTAVIQPRLIRSMPRRPDTSYASIASVLDSIPPRALDVDDSMPMYAPIEHANQFDV